MLTLEIASVFNAWLARAIYHWHSLGWRTTYQLYLQQVMGMSVPAVGRRHPMDMHRRKMHSTVVTTIQYWYDKMTNSPAHWVYRASHGHRAAHISASLKMMRQRRRQQHCFVLMVIAMCNNCLQNEINKLLKWALMSTSEIQLCQILFSALNFAHSTAIWYYIVDTIAIWCMGMGMHSICLRLYRVRCTYVVCFQSIDTDTDMTSCMCRCVRWKGFLTLIWNQFIRKERQFSVCAGRAQAFYVCTIWS